MYISIYWTHKHTYIDRVGFPNLLPVDNTCNLLQKWLRAFVIIVGFSGRVHLELFV